MWCGYLRHFAKSSTIVRFRFLRAAPRGLRIFSPVNSRHAFHSRQKSRKRVGDNSVWRTECPCAGWLDVAVAEISQQGTGVVPLIGLPVIASAATEAARTGSRSISANSEATSGYPAPPSQRLPHPP